MSGFDERSNVSGPGKATLTSADAPPQPGPGKSTLSAGALPRATHEHVAPARVVENDDAQSLNAILKVMAYGRDGRVIARAGVRAHWVGHLPTKYRGAHGQSWIWSDPAARDTRLQTNADGTGGTSIEAWAQRIGAASVDIFAEPIGAVTTRADAQKDQHAPGHTTDAHDAGDGSTETEGSGSHADEGTTAGHAGGAHMDSADAGPHGDGAVGKDAHQLGGQELEDDEFEAPDPEEDRIAAEFERELEIDPDADADGDEESTGGHGKLGGDSLGRVGSDTTVGGSGPGGERVTWDGDNEGSPTHRGNDGSTKGDKDGDKGGAANGRYGGEGAPGSDGVRNNPALFGGLMGVPGALKGLVELLLLVWEGDILGLGGDLVKTVFRGLAKRATKPTVIAIRTLVATEARKAARTAEKDLIKRLVNNKEWKALSKAERMQALRMIYWQNQRLYFRGFVRAAKVEQRNAARLLKNATEPRKAALQVRIEGAKLAEDAGKVEPVAGRLPRNHEYAGQYYPRELLPPKYRERGLRFKDTGYPDFEPHAMTLPNGKKTVRIELTGSRRADFAAADRAANLVERPEGYVWHHAEDEGTMMLVPTELHESVGHSGGVASSKHRTGVKIYGN